MKGGHFISHFRPLVLEKEYNKVSFSVIDTAKYLLSFLRVCFCWFCCSVCFFFFLMRSSISVL